MVTDALERAKKALQFEDLFQTTVSAWVQDGFDPKFYPVPEASCRLQFKHTVMQSNVLEFDSNDEAEAIFRVSIGVGVRLFYDETSSDEAAVQIEASYCLDYRFTDAALKLDQEALDEFALKNASYHLWPFWREYILSQCSRMNVPKIPLPMRFIGTNPVKPNV